MVALIRSMGSISDYVEHMRVSPQLILPRR